MIWRQLRQEKWTTTFEDSSNVNKALFLGVALQGGLRLDSHDKFRFRYEMSIWKFGIDRLQSREWLQFPLLVELGPTELRFLLPTLLL